MLELELTIEPSRDGGVNVYAHDAYPGSSVLAGQPRRSYLINFDTAEEALEAYPDAEVIEGSSKPWRPADATLEEISGLPEHPPAWFDPRAAGERWNPDD